MIHKLGGHGSGGSLKSVGLATKNEVSRKATRPLGATARNLVMIQDLSGEIQDSGVSVDAFGDRVAKAGDTMSGELDMSGKRIRNLPESPHDKQDATSKAYVDQSTAEAVLRDGTRVMTGHLSMGMHFIHELKDPANPQDAATKNYIDRQIATNAAMDSTPTLTICPPDYYNVINLVKLGEGLLSFLLTTPKGGVSAAFLPEYTLIVKRAKELLRLYGEADGALHSWPVIRSLHQKMIEILEVLPRDRLDAFVQANPAVPYTSAKYQRWVSNKIKFFDTVVKKKAITDKETLDVIHAQQTILRVGLDTMYVNNALLNILLDTPNPPPPDEQE